MTSRPSLTEADRVRPVPPIEVPPHPVLAHPVAPDPLVPGPPGPAVASGVKLLLSGEHADPRAAQAVVLLPVLLEILLRRLTGAAFDGWFVLGSVVAAVPTVGAVLIGRGWLST
ncbi:MAG: sensor histidine kinase, partial [Frankiales bacterium]|nr:sensor histidine kinase [Frankiales bacterium]